MDVKDTKILQELDKEPRITTSKLAKRVRISQQVADYRLKRLKEQGIITKFGTIINMYRLGLQQYRIFFRFNEIGDQRKREIFSYLKKNAHVYWAARIGGRYDLVIVVGVVDYPTFDVFLDELYTSFPKCFRSYQSVYVLTHELYRHKYLNPKQKVFDTLSYGTGVQVAELDVLDWKILHSIKDDCRIPALVLAQQFGTSYKTIQNRIEKFKKNGVIVGNRIFVHTEDKKPFIVLLTYSEYSKSREKKFLSEVRAHPKVTQALHCFGKWRVFLHVRVKDLEELQSFIISLREKHTIIREHEAVPVFEDIHINLLPAEK